MGAIKKSPFREWAAVIPGKIPKEVLPEDRNIFFDVIDDTLTSEQKTMVIAVGSVLSRQTHLLAVHWHPEFVPMELIARRIRAMFPAATDELIIPTQHNELSSFEAYCGAEIDCFAQRFKQKVQLLIHLHHSRLA